MKKLMIMALAAFSLIAVKAKASELSLTANGNQPFTLVFDNQYYASPSNTYNITEIVPGAHHVRMMSVPMVYNGAYAMPVLLFDGWVTIPNNSFVTAIALDPCRINIVNIAPLYSYAPPVVCGPVYHYGYGGAYYNGGYYYPHHDADDYYHHDGDDYHHDGDHHEGGYYGHGGDDHGHGGNDHGGENHGNGGGGNYGNGGGGNHGNGGGTVYGHRR